ncbi:hypothetical protein GCM10011378_11550 [Hymenobacter glacieicola]|uniref:Uncharacterized protein n=1 Tax=Hymenobacter glacieicola TaxID=1562124 RepID=A0ABQ1WPA0_9BACT|nr:hypothetical protein GCM10011378_11550 [Hymenobacter glacieicola]
MVGGQLIRQFVADSFANDIFAAELAQTPNVIQGYSIDNKIVASEEVGAL